ncbi:multicopy suppressor of pop two [Kluyveromyces marxianus]|uniref:Multicopy suppressor of pop two n=1 Tax=Kluyveromyces marxianus TaxID=4911 RepID=A0ABX6F5I3_KLUMA|nr:multicopy suppressor of pop two [Kluyveromyces marxianus]
MMHFQHQPQLSVNSVQSLIEPVTPPLGQMNAKNNHQRTHSLDLSGFNQFISNTSPLNCTTVSPLSTISATANANAASGKTNRMNSLPLINEFESILPQGRTPGQGQGQGQGQASATKTHKPHASSSSHSSNSVAMSSVSSASSSSASSTAAGQTHGQIPGQGQGQGQGQHGSSSSSSSSKTSASAVASINDLHSIPLKELDYVKLSTDQYGCRFLQRKLETPQESDQVRDLIFENVNDFFLDLILDPFGNYLIQKLCDYLTSDQKTAMIKDIYPSVFQISINQYGTRSLQKIIDTVETQEHIDMIIKGFSQEHTSIEQVVTLINDLNGNHVIQKCIFRFQPANFDFIIDAIVNNDNIITISTHKHGCCVLQKLLSVCTLQQIFKISVKIIQYLPSLINDQFGNYIIQFLFDIKELDFYLLGETFNKLSQKLCQLSCLKFSSNVVEKYIKKLFAIVMNYALTASKNVGSMGSVTNAAGAGAAAAAAANPHLEMDRVDDGDDVVNASMGILLVIADIFMSNITSLIRDNYGNYALQTLLDVRNYSAILEHPKNNVVYTNQRLASFSHEFTLKISKLIIITKELLPSIKNTSYAKKIKLKVRAYTELTGVSFDDLCPAKKKGNEPFRQQNKHHSRNFSLPSNAYMNHSRSGGQQPNNSNNNNNQFQRNSSLNIMAGTDNKKKNKNNGNNGNTNNININNNTNNTNNMQPQLSLPHYQQIPAVSMPSQHDYLFSQQQQQQQQQLPPPPPQMTMLQQAPPLQQQQQQQQHQPQQHVNLQTTPLQVQQPQDYFMSAPNSQQPVLMNSTLHYPSNTVANMPNTMYMDTTQYPTPQSHSSMMYGFPTQSQPGLTPSMSQSSFVSLPGSLSGSNLMQMSDSQTNTPPNGMLPRSNSNIMQHSRNVSFPMFGDNPAYYG